MLCFSLVYCIDVFCINALLHWFFDSKIIILCFNNVNLKQELFDLESLKCFEEGDGMKNCFKAERFERLKKAVSHSEASVVARSFIEKGEKKK